MTLDSKCWQNSPNQPIRGYSSSCYTGRGSLKKCLQALPPPLALVSPSFFPRLPTFFAGPQLLRAWNRLVLRRNGTKAIWPRHIFGRSIHIGRSRWNNMAPGKYGDRKIVRFVLLQLSLGALCFLFKKVLFPWNFKCWGCKRSVACCNTQFLVALANSESQFRTLLSLLPWLCQIKRGQSSLFWTFWGNNSNYLVKVLGFPKHFKRDYTNTMFSCWIALGRVWLATAMWCRCHMWGKGKKMAICLWKWNSFWSFEHKCGRLVVEGHYKVWMP